MSLPADYGYVFGALGLSFIANAYLAISVGQARKKFGVKYPAMYATKDHITKDVTVKDVEQFNCIQRAHQNTCENLASVQLLAVVNGLLSPKFAGACLAIYSVGRVVYGYGYKHGGPDGRRTGGILSHLGDLPLAILTFVNAYALLSGSA